MKEGRKPEYPGKTLGNELGKMPQTNVRRSKSQARLEPEQQHWWQARKADMHHSWPRRTEDCHSRPSRHRLVGLVVRRRLESGRSRVRIPLAQGFFSGSSHTSDLKIGTPVATLPGAWQNRVSTRTGRPGVSIL